MEKDLEKYKQAWEAQDIEALESLRLSHPEDARFALHLSLIELSPDEGEEFSDVNDSHKELLDALGLTGAPEFMRLLEQGNPKKIRTYVESLPEDNPLKESMLLLLPYVWKATFHALLTQG